MRDIVIRDRSSYRECADTMDAIKILDPEISVCCFFSASSLNSLTHLHSLLIFIYSTSLVERGA